MQSQLHQELILRKTQVYASIFDILESVTNQVSRIVRCENDDLPLMITLESSLELSLGYSPEIVVHLSSMAARQICPGTLGRNGEGRNTPLPASRPGLKRHSRASFTSDQDRQRDHLGRSGRAQLAEPDTPSAISPRMRLQSDVMRVHGDRLDHSRTRARSRCSSCLCDRGESRQPVLSSTAHSMSADSYHRSKTLRIAWEGVYGVLL